MTNEDWAPEVQLEESPVREHEHIEFRVGQFPHHVDINKPCWPWPPGVQDHVHPAEAPCNIKCPGWEG